MYDVQVPVQAGLQDPAQAQLYTVMFKKCFFLLIDKLFIKSQGNHIAIFVQLNTGTGYILYAVNANVLVLASVACHTH